jgi:hypothetical protein
VERGVLIELDPTEGAILKVWTRPTPTRYEASQLYYFLNKTMNQLQIPKHRKCSILSPEPFELNFYLRIARKVIMADRISIVPPEGKSQQGFWREIYSENTNNLSS